MCELKDAADLVIIRWFKRVLLCFVAMPTVPMYSFVYDCVRIKDSTSSQHLIQAELNSAQLNSTKPAARTKPKGNVSVSPFESFASKRSFTEKHGLDCLCMPTEPRRQVSASWIHSRSDLNGSICGTVYITTFTVKQCKNKIWSDMCGCLVASSGCCRKYSKQASFSL